MVKRFRWVFVTTVTVLFLALAGLYFIPRFLSASSRQIHLPASKIYSRCGHEWSGQKPDQVVLTILSRQKPGASYEGWMLRRVNGSLSLVRHEPGLCPDCARFQFLGLSGGRVASFAGKPARPGPVLESTRIRVETLPMAERHDLEKGISFADEGERLQILEGLTSLIDE